MRVKRYTSGTAEQAAAWQGGLRGELSRLLDLPDSKPEIGARVISTDARDGYVLEIVELNSTPGRRLKAAVARPSKYEGKLPAVVAIHGHGGDLMSPFNPEEGLYKTFGAELARRGFLVISTSVGQHDVYESERTLMGERLWDLVRCVDYVESLPEVDPERIGCGGLSLGGEMAMWLGAMDERVAATVSAGFLTVMDQMETNHCMCWKFDGLRELVDFSDIFAMIAPRALQCQNGLQEPATQFTPEIALGALRAIEPAYQDLGASQKLQMLVHGAGHEIALEQMIAFLEEHLRAAR